MSHLDDNFIIHKKTFRQIVNDIKRLNNISTDKGAALEIDFPYNTFRNRLSRNSIPYEELLMYCMENDLCPKQLFFEKRINYK